MSARRPDRTAALRLASWLVLAALAYLQAYLLLHEGGHALAAVAVGGTVRTVDARPWSSRPHAGYDLPEVSGGERALVSAAGTLLPLAAWGVVIAALPRALPPAQALVRLGASVPLLAGLLPWIALPWPALHPVAPRDDVVRFTQASGWPPVLVAGLALAVLLGGVNLLRLRTGSSVPLRALREIAGHGVPSRALATMAVLLGAGVALALGLHAIFPARAAGAPGDGVTLPAHDAIADVTLEATPFDGDFGLGVAVGSPVRLVIGFEDVSGGPFRVVAVDALGVEHGLADFGPGTSMGVATSRPRLELPPGAWQLRLTAEDTVGRFRAWVDDGTETPGP